MSAFPEALALCWHPVAYSHEVTDKPFATTLLEEALVIWRSADGAPHAMKDLCIHRGTALSLGWVSGDELVCGYHGWRYNAEGACTLIPQKANPTVVPTKARIQRYACMERYGLIWVLMGEAPRYALPEIPEFENGEWKIVNTGPFTWASDASRQVENFTDFGHFPWVHP
ncbi:MAG TPA: aromatic ring-hydroxylating dioxygenase subunit alpha, partial [Thermoflexales bacterium]|nr:aromatic ring-hydroxylating dioxygenase subunit alpha [Thermoflexales bacterium]